MKNVLSLILLLISNCLASPDLTSNVLDFVRDSDIAELNKVYNLIQEEKIKLQSNKENHLILCEKTLLTCKGKLENEICLSDWEIESSSLKVKIDESEEIIADSKDSLSTIKTLIQNNENDCKQITQVFEDNQQKFENEITNVSNILDVIKIRLTVLHEEEAERKRQEQIRREERITKAKIETEVNLQMTKNITETARLEGIAREQRIKVEREKIQENVKLLNDVKKRIDSINYNNTLEMRLRIEALEKLKDENFHTEERIQRELNKTIEYMNSVKEEEKQLQEENKSAFQDLVKQHNETQSDIHNILSQEENIKKLFQDEKEDFKNQSLLSQTFLNETLNAEKKLVEENQKTEEKLKLEIATIENTLKNFTEAEDNIRKENNQTLTKILKEKEDSLDYLKSLKEQIEKINKDCQDREKNIQEMFNKTQGGLGNLKEQKEEIESDSEILRNRKVLEGLINKTQESLNNLTENENKIREENKRALEDILNEKKKTEEMLNKLNDESSTIKSKIENVNSLIDTINSKIKNCSITHEVQVEVSNHTNGCSILNTLNQTSTLPINKTANITTAPIEITNNAVNPTDTLNTTPNNTEIFSPENNNATYSPGVKDFVDMKNYSSGDEIISQTPPVKETPKIDFQDSGADSFSTELIQKKINDKILIQTSLKQNQPGFFSNILNKVGNFFHSFSFVQINTSKESIDMLDLQLIDLANYTQKVEYLESSKSQLELILNNLQNSKVSLYDSYKESDKECKLRMKDMITKREDLNKQVVDTKFEIESLKRQLGLIESKKTLCQKIGDSMKVCNQLNDYCNNYQIEYSQEISELEDLMLYFKQYIDRL